MSKTFTAAVTDSEICGQDNEAVKYMYEYTQHTHSVYLSEDRKILSKDNSSSPLEEIHKL